MEPEGSLRPPKCIDSVLNIFMKVV